MSRRASGVFFAGKAKKKRLSIPVSQSEVPPKGAVFRVEYVSKEKPDYIKNRRNAEKLFNNPDVRSVSLIGKPVILSREEIMQLPSNSAVKKRLEAEDEAKKAVKAAQKIALDEERKRASFPENVLGIQKGKRYGRIELVLTEEGRKKGVSPFGYSISSEEILKLYEKGLIKGVKK